MSSYCGYIALVGRPNVGKSTLLNQILKHKVTITSRKPQTTRHSILGIQTNDTHQFIFVDTPGIHQGYNKTMNKLMNKTALAVLRDVDVIVFLVDALKWTDEDAYVMQRIQKVKAPCILVLNKVDKVSDKSKLLPMIDKLKHEHSFEAIIPLSAKTGVGVNELQQKLNALLPEGPHMFDEEQLTDRPVKFLCAELVREKIFRLSGQELPYSTTVDIESYVEEEGLVRIHALILVDKPNHKRMIIGEKGTKLKEISTSARKDIEHLLDKKVFLKCWVKVKSGWLDDEKLLKHLGYDH